MRVSTIAVALLSALNVAAGPSRKHAKYDRRVLLAQRQSTDNSTSDTGSEQMPAPYLNEKTRPYAVDGTSLPQVDFDIGESYAGLLPIGNDTNRNLFFWFVPSANPAASNEITIWLNGGPGCSSLDGFFHENGPVLWGWGTYRPYRNAYSWSNLTNMVWIDQPIGTGYSQKGKVTAQDEIDIADQFNDFWKNFMELFDLNGRDVYITGESYAGQYVPYIADGMLNRTDEEYYNVKGIMIYDPSISDDGVGEQAPTLNFVQKHQADFPFNDTYRGMLEQKSARCGYDEFMRIGMQFPPQGPLPPPPGETPPFNETSDDCDIFDDAINAALDMNPCFNIYQVGALCPIPWDVLGFPYSDFYLPPGYEVPYFDHPDVKRALHVPQDVQWVICSNGPVFVNDTDNSPPSGLPGGPLQRVIEKTNNTIVGHGDLDMVLILEGTLITLQNLTWNGVQGFSEPPTKPFYVPYHPTERAKESTFGSGVLGGWVSERGLTFVTIELAGHEVPQFQGTSAYRHLELLLGRIDSLSDRAPFSTQPGFPQPDQKPLGNAPPR